MFLAEDIELTYPNHVGERTHAYAGTMHMLHGQIYAKGGVSLPINGLPLHQQPDGTLRLLFSVRKRLAHVVVKPLKLAARRLCPVQHYLLDAVNGKGDPRRTGREGGQVENPSNDGRVATLSFAVPNHADAGDGKSEFSACVYAYGEVCTTPAGGRVFRPPARYVGGAVEFAKHARAPAVRISNVMDFPGMECSLFCLNHTSWRGRFHHNTQYAVIEQFGGDDELPRIVERVSVPPLLRVQAATADAQARSVLADGYVVAAYGTHAKKGTVATTRSAKAFAQRLGKQTAKKAAHRARSKNKKRKRKKR